MKEVKIVIADDHPIFLKGLKDVINSENSYKIKGIASNGKEVLEILNYTECDIVILDIDMPEMNGFECAEFVSKNFPNICIILLTMHKKKVFLLKALELGVNGYVIKDSTVTDILDSIKTVLEDEIYISPIMSEFLENNKNSFLVKAEKGYMLSNKKENIFLSILTESEKIILEKIGEYKSSKEIAEELFISERTVSNHRMNIAKKLNLKGKTGLLKFILENK